MVNNWLENLNKLEGDLRMIDRISSDLGIHQFEEETKLQYKCRVIYSALACWMKAIALDSPLGNKEHLVQGVSRRHLYDRSNAVLENMLKMFPDTNQWYCMNAEKGNPVLLVRERLVNHGDLLNVGFNTNLILSSVHTEQLISKVECVYGKIIDDDMKYVGISAIQNNVEDFRAEIQPVQAWLDLFVNEARWSYNLPDSNLIQYYDPLTTSKNNYSAWRDSIVEPVNGLVLARIGTNETGYSYYLIKPKKRLAHKLDQFLQEQGFHIRIMCALRSWVNNKTKINATRFEDHITIKLNAFLPKREGILLESYAWPLHSIDDVWSWVMSPEIWEYINPSLEALGIQIVEEKHG